MNFISILDLHKKDINRIFDKTKEIENKSDYTPLKGKTILLFFPESSIRTRITFEMAVKQLGGDIILFPPASLNKPEALKDVAGYINNWVDGIIVRHNDINVIRELSENCDIPVINAMTKENHPCEIISDLYSILQKKEDYLDLNYLFVGAGGNICNSWINASKVLGFDFTQCCLKSFISNENIKSTEDLEEVIVEADIVLTDSLSGQMKNQDYIEKFQITLELMDKARTNAILNPCPPFFRDEEVSSGVIDSKYFVGYGFKKNLLGVQKAIILCCLGNLS